MPKSPQAAPSGLSNLFFIDKKGDSLRKDESLKPVVNISLPVSVERVEPPKSKTKVLVIGSNSPSNEERDEDSDDHEVIHFKGHPSSLSPSEEDELDSDEYLISEGDSCDDSSADSDYIRNLKDHGDDYLLEDIQKMSLEALRAPEDEDEDLTDVEGSSLENDDDFAAMAHERSFLLRSPSTLMEFSLDETAAEFLSQKARRGKGKGKKGGKNKGQKPGEENIIDPFVYDGPYTVGEISFRQLNREIKTFINDDVEDELEMDPMPPLPRKFLHELAHMYGLKSKSSGQGRNRHCVLYKTERSSLPRNVNSVKQLIDRADKAVMWMDKSVSKGKKFTAASVPAHVKENRIPPGKGKSRKSGKKSSDSSQEPSTKPAAGSVVGQHARPIAEDNVGNKLLQKLGWKPGQGLGSASDGIVLPIDAVVRGKRQGIGHES